MSDFGLLTHDDYNVPDMPSELVGELPGQEEDPFKLIQMGLIGLNRRLKAAMEFANKVATSPGPCRCAYMPDPNCLICQAKRLLEDART